MNQLATGKITEAKRSALEELTGRPENSPVAPLLLGALSGTFDPSLAAPASTSPLRTGTRLSAFNDAALTALVTAAPERRWVALLLAGLPRSHRAVDEVDVVEALGADGVGRIIEQSKVELSGTKELRPALDALVGRIAASAKAAEVDFAALVNLVALVEPEGDGAAERLTGLLSHAATALRRAGEPEWAALPESARNGLARSLARLALVPERATLLAAIAQIDPVEVANARWWSGLEFDDLARVTTGPLVSVLAREEIALGVVRPRALEAIRGVSTRRALLTILAAAAPVAATLPPELVAAELTRVADSDSALHSWLRVIRDVETLQAVENERDRLAERLAQVEASLARAVEDAERQRANAERLDARVREAERSHTSMRGSQERQIRIDSMRALAELAAFVEGSSGRLEPDRLKARVTGLVGRQGVRRIETPDDVVAFDPRRHESVGAAIEPGGRVVVRRGGYTWDGPQEEIVLVRALVERA